MSSIKYKTGLKIECKKSSVKCGIVRKFCNVPSVREQENPYYSFGPFVREGIERHLKTNTVKLDAAKAQILDRWISLTVGTEMPKKKMISCRSHLAGYLKHYLCNILYLFPKTKLVRFLGFVLLVGYFGVLRCFFKQFKWY